MCLPVMEELAFNHLLLVHLFIVQVVAVVVLTLQLVALVAGLAALVVVAMADSQTEQQVLLMQEFQIPAVEVEATDLPDQLQIPLVVQVDLVRLFSNIQIL
jgi:hypothetical protein